MTSSVEKLGLSKRPWDAMAGQSYAPLHEPEHAYSSSDLFRPLGASFAISAKAAEPSAKWAALWDSLIERAAVSVAQASRLREFEIYNECLNVCALCAREHVPEAGDATIMAMVVEFGVAVLSGVGELESRTAPAMR